MVQAGSAAPQARQASALSRLAVILGWLTLLIGGGGGVNYYVWHRLVVEPALPAPWFLLVSLLMWGVPLSFPITYGIASKHGPFVPYWGHVAMHGFMGSVFYLALALLGLDLASLALGLVGAEELHGAFVVPRTFAALALLLGGTLALTAFLQAWRGPVVEQVLVPLRRAGHGLGGLKIAQISDVHLGSTVPRGYLRRVVDLVEKLEADLVAITGDLLEDPAEQVSEDLRELGRLSPALGTYFVSGNHDYYAGIAGCFAALEQAGVRVLRNERIELCFRDGRFDLAGVDDPTGRFIAGHGPDYQRALGGRDGSRALILLAHEPRSIHHTHHFAPELQLSGHTHAGQLWPFGWLVRLVEPYLSGLYAHTDRTLIYVSRGTGWWGPPMRLPRRCEITLLEIAEPTVETR
jgi:uncharacterized protein